MDTVASRISALVDYYVGSKHGRNKRFADKVGVTEFVVSNWVKRGAGTSVMMKIKKAFPEISVEWLLSGEGEMIKENDEVSPKDAHKPHEAPQEVQRRPLGSRIVQTLPVIPIEAKAGIGKGFLYDRDSSQDPDDIYDEFDAMEVFLEREVSDRYKLFRVKGDSMDDDTKRALCDGDIVLCREVYPEDWKHGLINTKYPNVVIVIEEEGILIKQLIKHSKKNETISLHSLNSAYKDLSIDLKKVRAFYYVERLIDRHMSQW
jgi:hypothetical protein